MQMTFPDVEQLKLDTAPLFVMNVLVDGAHAIGGPAGAVQRVGEIVGGTFTGERLSGIILPGGSDWQTIRSDRATMLDARIILQTSDGEMIGMTYRGIRHGAFAVMDAIARGEAVDPASYYFRTTATFTASAGRYDWLNRIVALGVGHRLAHGPVYKIFEVL